MDISLVTKFLGCSIAPSIDVHFRREKGMDGNIREDRKGNAIVRQNNAAV
jgi:hypothetical protein